MADVKISALPSLAQVDVAVGSDVLPIVDSSLPLTKNITPNALVKAVLAGPGPIGAGTPDTGAFTTVSASGGFTGNVTGNITGSAPAGNLTGTALASNVVNSSLISVGTLSSLTVSGSSSLNTLTASGQSSLGGSAGSESLRVLSIPSAANYLQASGAIAGGTPMLEVAGPDTNIGAILKSKGAANFRFDTGGGVQMRINHVASAVNFLTVFGAATGGRPAMYADGSDAAVDFAHSLKGAGSHVFFTNNTGNVQLAITHTASNRWLTMTGSNGGNPTIGTSSGGIQFSAIPIYPSYTVGTLPAVGTAGGNIYVSNESGGAVPAFSDGTNWRRVTDRAIVT